MNFQQELNKMSGASMTDDEIRVDILTEFVEVSIHCILYNRSLYPQGVFEKRVKYNVPVQMCLHPGVCEYVRNVVDSVKMLLLCGQVDKISVIILEEETGLPRERFVMELGRFHAGWKEKDPHLFQTEQALRDFLLKLNVSDALLHPASKDCTWTVHVETQDSAFSSVNDELIQKSFPWMEAEEKQKNLGDSKLVPFKSHSSDIFSMQMYAEEKSKGS